jgi:hypothetical protein
LKFFPGSCDAGDGSEYEEFAFGYLCSELLITFSISESIVGESDDFFESILLFITDWNELRICAEVGDCFI